MQALVVDIFYYLFQSQSKMREWSENPITTVNSLDHIPRNGKKNIVTTWRDHGQVYLWSHANEAKHARWCTYTKFARRFPICMYVRHCHMSKPASPSPLHTCSTHGYITLVYGPYHASRDWADRIGISSEMLFSIVPWTVSDSMLSGNPKDPRDVWGKSNAGSQVHCFLRVVI